MRGGCHCPNDSTPLTLKETGLGRCAPYPVNMYRESTPVARFQSTLKRLQALSVALTSRRQPTNQERALTKSSRGEVPAACESSDLGTHGSFETVALTLVVEAEVWVKESITSPYATSIMDLKVRVGAC